MAREIDENDIKRMEREKGLIRVTNWDGKKIIFDYVPKWRLRELIAKGYVLGAVE